MGRRIPNTVNQAPRPMIPFFPLIINKPVKASTAREIAYRSAVKVQIFFGTFK